MDADEGSRAVFHFFREETLVLFLCLCLIVLFLCFGAVRGGSAPAGLLENDIRIDINHAPWQQLVFIRGIGPQKAQAITEFRSEHGPFGSSRELEAVRGISTGLAKEIEANVIFR